MPQVFAFDLDARRLETLRKLTGLAGCTNIQSKNMSFLDVNPSDPTYAEVRAFLALSGFAIRSHSVVSIAFVRSAEALLIDYRSGWCSRAIALAP